MKAEELIRDALQELGIQAAEQPITADQMQTGIRYTNDMMEEFDYLKLGFTVINDASDEITVPAFARKWMKKQLAVEMAPQFTASSAFPIVQRQAENALSAVLLQSMNVQPAGYPCTLPTGSGNDHHGSRFFDCDEDLISTSDGENIQTEGN